MPSPEDPTADGHHLIQLLLVVFIIFLVSEAPSQDGILHSLHILILRNVPLMGAWLIPPCLQRLELVVNFYLSNP
jgi:hypothetical protein